MHHRERDAVGACVDGGGGVGRTTGESTKENAFPQTFRRRAINEQSSRSGRYGRRNWHSSLIKMREKSGLSRHVGQAAGPVM